MKIVINKCYGGFSLSPRAVRRLAELQGRECYFFNHVDPETGGRNLHRHYPISLEQAESACLFWSAFDLPDPDARISSQDRWAEMTVEQRAASNEEWERHSLTARDWKRNDPLLIQVVEELGGGHGTGASGACAALAIVEIPDGVEFEIKEYDGNEHVAERHRTWR